MGKGKGSQAHSTCAVLSFRWDPAPKIIDDKKKNTVAMRRKRERRSKRPQLDKARCQLYLFGDEI